MFVSEPCCALKYYPEIELCHKEVEGEETSKRKLEERRIMEDFGNTQCGKVRKYLWNLTEYPETSRAAQVSSVESHTHFWAINFFNMANFLSRWEFSLSFLKTNTFSTNYRVARKVLA